MTKEKSRAKGEKKGAPKEFSTRRAQQIYLEGTRVTRFT